MPRAGVSRRGFAPKRQGLPGGDTVSAAEQTSPPTAARPPLVLPSRPARLQSRAQDHFPAWKGAVPRGMLTSSQ